MAYTGILIRGNTFNNIQADPPINREIVTAGDHFGIVTYEGNKYYINLSVLKYFGEIDVDGSVSYAGFKTSNVPITFDSGLFDDTVDANYLVVSGHNWNYAALEGIEKATSTELKVGGVSLDVANLQFIGSKPTIDSLSTTDITVSWSVGLKALVYNITTSTALGEVTTSGGTLTFASAISSGDEVKVWVVDADDNKTLQTKGITP
jgi:hypothetical protein